MLKRLLPLITVTTALAAAAALLGLPAASAATLPQASSANWAGYVADSNSGFTSVSGSWVQPSANPNAGDGDSAFWVGLGGDGNSQSGSLEQIGTQADVVNGQTQYYAWYELVPAGQVQINMAIHPGDHMSARVSVSGTSVTVSLSDQTTGQSYTNTLQMDNPDTSSAEWIAEAPSASDGTGNLQTLPLADFGTANFTSAAATSAGHTGTISDSSWSSRAVQLGGSTAGAQPSGLSSDGSSFSVTWQSSSTATDTSSGGAGSGYGGYSPYGDPGAYGGGGYGSYGYGGGGYGDGGYGYGGYYGYAQPGYVYGY